MKQMIRASKRLVKQLDGMAFSEPVDRYYQPLTYAWKGHEAYLQAYGAGRKRVVFLGMNPGPYGMAQTGVPFGEVSAVRDWMHLEVAVGRPANEHPKRPIEGFACKKSEVSGRRLWGLFADRFASAEVFFQDHFVLNYCPLIWMNANGANLTPDKIAAAEMKGVEAACMEHLVEVLGILQPEYAIGVGAYAEERLLRAKGIGGYLLQVGKILHPSPASPAANRGWAEVATRQLKELGVW